MNKDVPTIQDIKNLGKNRSEDSIHLLFDYFDMDLSIDLKREIISSIGRQDDDKLVYDFIEKKAFSDLPMELIYQIYRTCLYKGKYDDKFKLFGEKIKRHYNNEVIDKMYSYFQYRMKRKKRKKIKKIDKPLLLCGDTEKNLNKLPEQSVNLIFTSPPYYNAREYSDYHSYNEYLDKMKKIFIECNKVLEDGRFMIVNISPVITKRPGREFESIRYPIHYDFHRILIESGFYFIDEIIWIKPEPSVPNRVGGYMQTKKPLSYKPNCITESIMVYRKNCDFLLDKNINDYKSFNKNENDVIDTSNCWYIAPKSDKNHPAVFPEELCRRIVKYYSFEGDVVLDPFAGSGTLGRVANKMNRIPVMSEMNKKYIELINKDEDIKYDNI
ncbi:site-specific DNA-methyltransferase [Enterococcus cecorum]|uniref:DNA-methyltransferase n=1 Tax=Enterococcus cecorum TaxID=44008 RepID=UPI0032C4730D